MERRANDLGIGLIEVVSFVNTPPSISDMIECVGCRVVGCGCDRSLIVRIFIHLVVFCLPGKNGTITADGIYLVISTESCGKSRALLTYCRPI